MGDWSSSYVLGNDTENGWGQRYFFTYFSERDSRKTVLVNVEIIVLLVTFVFSVVANLSIAAAVLRYREMRTVTNCFLLNLAVADLLFAAGIPLVALARVPSEWQLGGLTCRLLPYSQFVCGFVLLWTLTLISMDRHRCLVVPPYRSNFTPRRAAILTLATWLVAAILFLPVAAWFQYYENVGVCTLVFPRSDYINVSLIFVIPVILFTCLLPMSLLVFHYQRIFHKLLKTRSRWTIAPVEPPRRINDPSRKISLQHIVYPGKTSTLSHHEELRLNKHIRVVRVLLLNVLVVLLMWLPITIIMFLIYLDGSRPNEDTGFFLRSHHFIWALLIALLNTVVNPLLYGVLSENFRAYLTRMWFGSKRHRNVSNFFDDGVSRGGKTPSFGQHLSPGSVPSVTDLPSACAL